MTTTGVVIGKFFPPHRGHRHLIETAARSCDELFVLLLGNSDEERVIPIAQRDAWLRELVESDRVHVRTRLIDAPLSWTDPTIVAFWNRVILGMVGRPTVDFLFTSERGTYGVPTAAGIGASHVCVDPNRATFPVSGTAVRRDPFSHWEYLDPPVRAFYAARVRIVGGESTGKTTFADLLARRFATAWVPEFGRAYSDPKDARGEPWSTSDFVSIARRQGELEDVTARRADRLLVCDTDPMTTGIWHRVYLGSRSFEVDAIGAVRRYAITIVADSDIPWVQDGDRNSREERVRQQDELSARLEELGAPYTVIGGSRIERVERAVEVVAATTGLEPPIDGQRWLHAGMADRWTWLEARRHEWRRSLWLAGTDRTATAVADELTDRGLDYETLAAELGVSLNAVREADWYAARNSALTYAEARRDLDRIAALAGRDR